MWAVDAAPWEDQPINPTKSIAILFCQITNVAYLVAISKLYRFERNKSRHWGNSLTRPSNALMRITCLSR